MSQRISLQVADTEASRVAEDELAGFTNLTQGHKHSHRPSLQLLMVVANAAYICITAYSQQSRYLCIPLIYRTSLLFPLCGYRKLRLGETE